MMQGPPPSDREQEEALVRVSLSLPRDARYVGLLRNLATCVLEDLDAPTAVIDDIGLVLTEACANVVRHADGTKGYTVSLAAGAHSCQVEVSDDGPGLDPDEMTRRDPADPTAESGRGLFLIETLVDDLEFDPEATGTSVRLVKRWDGLDLGFAGDEDRRDRGQPLFSVEIEHPDGGAAAAFAATTGAPGERRPVGPPPDRTPG